MMNINIFGDSNIGKISSNNEDAFIAEKIWDNEHFIAVAIDGVGGHEGGEEAARIAKVSIVNYLTNNKNGERSSLIKEAVNEANNEIFKERQIQPEYYNMSCVLTACLVELPKLKIHLAHVGDTRLYRYTNGKIVKLSHDHSLIGYREEIGDLTEEQAMNHPQRNIIGRDVGSEYHKIDDEDFIETGSFSFLPGSLFLLCSDGLCDMVTSAEMELILAEKGTVNYKVKALIDKANEKGGKDNITVVLIEFEKSDFEKNKIEIEDKKKINERIHVKEKNAINISHEIKHKSDNFTPISKQGEKKRKIIWLIILLIGAAVGWFLNNLYTFKYQSNDLFKNVDVYKDNRIKNDSLKIDSLKKLLQQNDNN